MCKHNKNEEIAPVEWQAVQQSGTFGGHKPQNWRTTGKTMGAAPDGRELPEWVEFEWSEPGYPYPEQSLEAYRALPLKTARVVLRSRIPQEVVNEVMEANLMREAHKLPEKRVRV